MRATLGPLLLALGPLLASCSDNATAPDAGPCPPGQTECGPTGACVDLTDDPNDCGGCGQACLPGQSCLEASCTSQIISVCPLGLAFCSDAGACVDLAADPNNCGSCGATCAPGQSCLARACTSAAVPDAGGDGGTDAGPTCPLGLLLCTEAGTLRCIDPAIDPENCGDCGVSCGPLAQCAAGTCGCAATAASCGAPTGPLACVDLSTDSTDCGACGVSCLACESCGGGACSSGPLYGSPEIFSNATLIATLLASGDFDGDGIADLVLGAPGDQLALLRGLADGGFAPGATLATLASFQALTVADFDGDGRADVAVAGSAITDTGGELVVLGSVQVLFGQPDGTLDSGLFLQIDAGGFFGNQPATLLGAGNLDRSGFPALIFDLNGASEIAFSTPDAGQRFRFQPGLNLSTSGLLSPNPKIATIDLNGDGLPDLAYVDVPTGALFAAYQLGDGGFLPPAQLTAGGVVDFTTGAFGPDGGLALIVDFSTNQVRGLAPQGATPTVIFQLWSDQALGALAAADVNGDGILDLAGLTGDSSVITWFQSVDAGFHAGVVSPTLLNLSASAVAVVLGSHRLPALAAALQLSPGAAVLEPTCP